MPPRDPNEDDDDDEEEDEKRTRTSTTRNLRSSGNPTTMISGLAPEPHEHETVAPSIIPVRRSRSRRPTLPKNERLRGRHGTTCLATDRTR